MIVQYIHAKLIQDAQKAGITVEDLARAWASIDGKRDEFDRGKVDHDYEDTAGHYEGYLAEAEEMLRRATKYARDRKT